MSKKLIKNSLYILLLSIGVISDVSYAQTSSTTTATAKASATLAALCTISSQNVNFGQISLPIGSQTSTSSMTVQCTKGSSYTIGLAYGGVYGQGQSANWVIQNASGIYAYNSSTQAYQKITSIPSGYVSTTGPVSCYNTWGPNGVTTAAGASACYGYST